MQSAVTIVFDRPNDREKNQDRKNYHRTLILSLLRQPGVLDVTASRGLPRVREALRAPEGAPLYPCRAFHDTFCCCGERSPQAANGDSFAHPPRAFVHIVPPLFRTHGRTQACRRTYR